VPRKRSSSKSGIDHKRTPIVPTDQPLSQGQLRFLQRVAAAIPRLFAALEEGNVKSELILGLRRVHNQQARLKIVAELVDSGANPLQTHGIRESEEVRHQEEGCQTTKKRQTEESEEERL